MKNVLKVFFVILLILIIIIPNICYADNLGIGDLENYRGKGDDSNKLTSKAETVLGVIQVIGTVVAVVMLMVIGIKYMLGSVEERAEYKDTLKPYLIGAFLLFSGSTIPQIIYRIAQDL